jgi:hypothetical protein
LGKTRASSLLALAMLHDPARASKLLAAPERQLPSVFSIASGARDGDTNRFLARWCNGNTEAFGAFIHGSNPCRAASGNQRLKMSVPSSVPRKNQNKGAMHRGNFINPPPSFSWRVDAQWLEERPEVSEKAKKLYAYLTYFAGGKGYAWPTFNTLAEKLHAEVVEHQTKLGFTPDDPPPKLKAPMPIESPSNTPIGNRSHSEFVLSTVDGCSHKTYTDGSAVTVVNFKSYTQTIPDPERRLFDSSSTNSNQSAPMSCSSLPGAIARGWGRTSSPSGLEG